MTQSVSIEGFAGMNTMRKIGASSARSYFNMPKTYVSGMLLLQNCYITTAYSIRKRPCLKFSQNVAGTIGLVAAKGKIYVFYSTGAAPALPTNYVARKIPNPNAPTTSQITAINFATVFLDDVFVVATYDDGSTHYFYFLGSQQWAASTPYQLNDVVQASNAYVAANGDPGYYFKLTSVSASPPTWTANATHALGDFVVPTVPNGYKYDAVAVTGSPPQSGAIEPAWPTTGVNAEVVEIRDPTSQIAPTTYVPPTTPLLGPFYNTQFNSPLGGTIGVLGHRVLRP